MGTSVADSCATADGPLLGVDEARQRILDSIRTIDDTERVHLRAARNRVLAEAVVSAIDVPPFANSAMDGYAIRSADCNRTGATRLKLVGTCLAGSPFEGEVGPGQCVRITTGAPMPAGADTVIMQEQVERTNEAIEFSDLAPAEGKNVRYAGEDTRRGEVVLQPGTPIGPAEIGLLASVGVAEVSVRRRPRAAFFSTGDELSSLGSPLAPGRIYDSNRYMLFALLEQAGLDCHDLGVVADERDAVRAAFRQAAACADLIVTSGGVSVGDADYVTETLAEMGEINFWRMAMKPGKPLAFGHLQQSCFFGLPGNPVSVVVTFYQFVLPAIRKMRGEPARAPLLLQARAAQALRKSRGRAEFQRGILSRDENGEWTVTGAGGQESHLLSSMCKANCFVLLPAECTGVAKGETVSVQPFSGLV